MKGLDLFVDLPLHNLVLLYLIEDSLKCVVDILPAEPTRFPRLLLLLFQYMLLPLLLCHSFLLHERFQSFVSLHLLNHFRYKCEQWLDLVDLPLRLGFYEEGLHMEIDECIDVPLGASNQRD